MGNSTISMVKNRKVKEITRVLPPCIGIATAPINGHGFNIAMLNYPSFTIHRDTNGSAVQVASDAADPWNLPFAAPHAPGTHA